MPRTSTGNVCMPAMADTAGFTQGVTAMRGVEIDRLHMTRTTRSTYKTIQHPAALAAR